MKLAIAFTLAFAATANAEPIVPAKCLPMDDFLELMAETDEVLTGISAVAPLGAVSEVWSNEETGDYTLVRNFNEDKICMWAKGNDSYFDTNKR